MSKLWQGRTSGDTNAAADEFNSSIAFDKRLYKQDIRGSMAHAAMLKKQGIISGQSADRIIGGLEGILADLESGRLEIDPSAEDIHMFVEQILTERIGSDGKKLHTARSRNDQVALDTRLWCLDEIDGIKKALFGLIDVLSARAGESKDVIMPGYTHLQRAQPVSFAHHLLAYAWMFLRDIQRLSDCRKRTDVSVIGCCALAGTTYDTDRALEAGLLGLSGVNENSLDGVSDRDFCAELLFDLSTIMMHLSRFCEELILWSSWEFRFIELSDSFTTGSSIMPQKKNPDMAELIRGKTARVYGDLMTVMALMKSLPLAYNKDMQEDKPALFDAVDNVKACIAVFTPMVSEMKINAGNMLSAANGGFINATDLADYLVGKGLPFRSAYKISGELVAFCISNGLTLESCPIDIYKQTCELIDDDVYEAVNIENCMNRRTSLGGPAADSVERQIASLKKQLE
ncbi:MAG: argininosuccinate lyase [Clostridia bacterium]|nr:argininosuccinate lyase [Clostridia bacterium]